MRIRFHCDDCDTDYQTADQAQKCAHPGTGTLRKIRAELIRARTKFPGNEKLTVALMEEVGELAQALLQDKPREEIVKEAVQVACVAVRIAEEGDADFGSDKEWSKAK